MPPLAQLTTRIITCRRCPRLRAYCEKVARERRAAYATEKYWGRPVPGFGDPAARLWIIGLAPGAHGANRTGRVFTGDRSGDFLFAALHRAGLANQPTSRGINDGLTLKDCFISAAARCAPPGNRPTPAELNRCAPFLDAEWDLLKNKRTILALGQIAWTAAIKLAARQNLPPTKTPFAHGAIADLSPTNDNKRDGSPSWFPTLRLVASYHVSQQNTFTGRLTEKMFDDVLKLCRRQCLHS